MTIAAPPLYPDQAAFRALLYRTIREGAQRICAVQQTGWGKGNLIAAMLADCASTGKRSAVVTHLDAINRDLIERIRAHGIEPRVLMGSEKQGPADSLVTVVSEQTAARRGLALDVRLCIRDECHRVKSVSGEQIVASCPPGAIHVGFTATPSRGDGRPLDTYQVLLQGAQMAELVAAGRIAPMRAFSPRSRGTGLAQDPVECWPIDPATGRARPGVLFADSVQHSRSLVPRFAGERNIAAIHCDAGTPNRAALIDRFNAGGPGAPDILTCWRLLQEGVDTRRAEVCMVASKVGHIQIARQMWGRVRRLYPGKEMSYLYDLRDNLADLDCYPDSDLFYSLDGAQGIRVADGAESDAFPMRCCAECFAWSRSGAPCQVCGALVPPPPPPALSRREMVEVLHQRQRLAGAAWEEWLAHCRPRLLKGKTPQQIAAAWMFERKRPPAFTVAQAVESLAASEAVGQARQAIEGRQARA